MGQKYFYGANNVAWNLGDCEERHLIAVYHDTRGFVQTDGRWKVDFEFGFFSDGAGVPQKSLDQLNAVRKDKELHEIAFQETDVGYDYARLNDETSEIQRQAYQAAAPWQITTLRPTRYLGRDQP